MKKKKGFLLFLVLVFILSACGTKEKDAPKEEQEQVENTQGENKQEGNTQEKNTQEESKQEETKSEENDSHTEPDSSNNNEADMPKPDPGTPDPELSSKPLEFFGGSFYDEDGFTFDGFTLMSDYEILEKRMALTETEQEPQISEQEPPHNIAGMTQTVKYYQVSVDEYPEAVGEITYLFYEKQFLGGNIAIQFPDYAQAKGFFDALDEELVKRNVAEELGKTEEENQASAYYVDKRSIYVQLKARELEDQKGEIRFDFSERVNRYGMQGKDSIYFDFQEK